MVFTCKSQIGTDVFPSPSSGNSLSLLGPAFRWSRYPAALLIFSLISLFVIPRASHAQTGNQLPLITQAVDETKLTSLPGNTHPLARAEFDHGAAPANLAMQRMLLVLGRSSAQEAALENLLEEQQDKSSPNFHKWLTPDGFGQQFGASDQDIQTIISWLEGHGFQVAGVSHGHDVIEFSGNAQEVQQAFHAAIHSYVVNGGQYWANASDPEIPSALAPAVIGIDSLNNFRKKAAHHLVGITARQMAGEWTKSQPALTYQCGNNPNTGAPIYCNALGPYDFATIYNVLPLWTASPAIDGTGESIAIVGRSNIYLQDVANFRELFDLPANPPQIILDGPDPGVIDNEDETEADLDVEWSGAVAKGATIMLVVSESTETTDGVDLSAEYAVDNNIAPIMSESFGSCELEMGTAGNQFYKNLWEQAAAQGISVFVAAGDQGSAGCDFFQGTAPQAAQEGLQVNGIASTPYDVSVGGTDFNDFFNELTYWNTTNNPTTQESAKGYIPETTWNDSCTNAIFGQIGYSTNAETNCNNNQLSSAVVTIGGSGGASACTNPTGSTPLTCAGGYGKPPWQTANGVPNDAKRDLPDVSLFASNGFLDNSYVICEMDYESSACGAANQIGTIGGTSVASPAFAGLLALVDQQAGTREGNPNFVFYKLEQSQAGMSCNSSTGPASTCVFNDVTSGTIAMPCVRGSVNCTTATPGDQYGVLSGYSTAPGYDLATGLGSVNANNLVNDWSTVKFTPSTTTLALNGGSAVNIVHGSSISVNVAVSPTSPQPTGDVSLIATQGNNSYGFDTMTLANGAASGSTNMLPGGSSYTVKAHYEGDVNYGGSDSNAVTVTVTPESSKTALRIVTFDPTSGAVINPNATSFVYGSPYLLRADVTNSSGNDCFVAGSSGPTYACPTGNVAIVDNGTALASSGFGLNSQGYTEDQSVQLTGGTHTLTGNYSGDNSYNASSGTDAVTVTPAATTTTILTPISSVPPQAVVIGTPFGVAMQMHAQSNGVAPTGTFTVFDGSTQLAGTASTVGFVGGPDQVFLNGNISTTVSGSSGPHTLTVQYSGDANYASSTSSAVTVNALYPTTTAVSVNPTSIIYGNSVTVTVTATMSTGKPASNATLKPTGTISFSGSFDGPITNPVTTTVAQDSNGNWIMQATVMIKPGQSENVNADYSGDSTYALSIGISPTILVTTPDFNLSANPSQLTITAGQTGTTTLTITPLTNDTSTVALSCSQINAPIPGATCTISPSSVTLNNGVAATAVLSLSLLAPSSSLTAVSSPFGTNRPRLSPVRGRDMWWLLSYSAGLAALVMIILPGRKRNVRPLSGLAFICVLSLAIGCAGGNNGGVGNGGGGNGGGGNGGGGSAGPVTTTTTLETSATKIAIGSSVSLSASVGSSATVTGYINFMDASFPFVIASYVGLNNSSAQTQLNAIGSVFPGTHVITASYSGDSNNLPSQSGPLNITITGSTQETIYAQTGTDLHSAVVNVTIQ